MDPVAQAKSPANLKGQFDRLVLREGRLLLNHRAVFENYRLLQFEWWWFALSVSIRTVFNETFSGYANNS